MGKWSSRVFELQGASAVIAFRLIILCLILFFTLYSRELIAPDGQIRTGPFFWVAGAALLHLASNGLVYLSSRRIVRRSFFFIVFVFDVALISLVIFLTQGFENDLFLIYFLVIFMTALSRKPFNTFSVAGLGCLMYGFIFLKNHPAQELLSPPILIRFPLFLIAALFSHVISMNIEGDTDEARKSAESKLKSAILISHEIRAPLTAMKSAVHFLYENENRPLSESQKRFMDILKRNIDRLHALANNILSFAALLSGHAEFKIEEGDLNGTVREVLDSYRRTGEETKVALNLELDPALRGVRFDSERIVQTLHNLIGNVLKFTSQGAVTVATSLDPKTQSAVVSVKDTGPGIRAEDLPKLFQEFQQVGEAALRRRQKGTGLGLAICKQIIQGHGGRIQARSVFGRGSEFSFSLPLKNRN